MLLCWRESAHVLVAHVPGNCRLVKYLVLVWVAGRLLTASPNRVQSPCTCTLTDTRKSRERLVYTWRVAAFNARFSHCTYILTYPHSHAQAGETCLHVACRVENSQKKHNTMEEICKMQQAKPFFKMTCEVGDLCQALCMSAACMFVCTYVCNVCVYVCVCICMCVYICVYIYINIYIYTHIYMPTYTCLSAIHTHTHTHMHACRYTCLRAVCMYIYIYIHTYMHAYRNVLLCVYIHTFMHTYTH
jgi:hypothetical protein